MVKNKNIKLSLKEKILKFLIENKEPLSILQISKQLNTDYKNVFNVIRSYSDLLIKDKRGNTSFIEIKGSPNPEIFNIEQKRREEFLSKNPQLKIASEYITEINYPFMIVLVFGSYAKRTNTIHSDLDICVISDNKEKANKLVNSLGILSLKMEIQEFTTDEFASMISKRENNLGHEIIKNNVILYGTENYYNLISKWMKKE